MKWVISLIPPEPTLAGPLPQEAVFKYIPGERYEYGNVGAASYWKLEHAAGFQLWSIDRHYKAIRQVRTGPKVDYCLRDLLRLFDSDPRRRVSETYVELPSGRVLGHRVGVAAP